ncbi:MAG: cyclic nucleotide-binding domain-containing protein, partial [Myxococcales bacterium]|nr:cyclic nucleotide-binding domain-containing protein [Myxococcales bacterium]
ADAMVYSPYAPDEVITRQGAQPHWLYMIISGQASVRVALPTGAESEVARLGSGEFFGEAAILTGEPRSASVVAVDEVECFRLNKDVFLDVLRARPELAADVAEILASRAAELGVTRQRLAEVSSQPKVASSHFLTRLRRVLGLVENG